MDITGTPGNDELSGTPGDDNLIGLAGDDTLLAGEGNDSLTGGAGNDVLDGGSGYDHAGYWDADSGVVVNLASGSATGGAGNDTLQGIESVSGSAHGDELLGDEMNNALHGDGGNDLLMGYGGDDFLVGGQGDDVIDGGTNGWFGDNVSYMSSTGGVVVDLAAGTADDGMGGTDTLLNVEHVDGSMHDDALYGDWQVNWFRPGGGNDVVDGRGGQDVVMYESSTSGATINLQQGVASGADIGTDVLVSIEAAHGTRFDDHITLSDVSGYLFGREGNDVLVGGAGWHANGFGGNNFIGGSGNDTIIGGSGQQDTVSYFEDGYDATPTGNGVVVNLQAGTATDNWGHTDTLSGIEGVSGSERDDDITGSVAAGEYFHGHGGNDRIDGGGGNDFVDGGIGDDALFGGANEDFIAGGRGNDFIDGGAGSDTVGYYDDGMGGGANGVTVNLAQGWAIDNYGHSDTLVGIESVNGTDFDDVVTGGAAAQEFFNGNRGNDRIDGGAGSDHVDGGDGDDILSGGADNDHIVGGRGNDVIQGGAGSDSVSYWDDGSGGGARGVTVHLGEGWAIDNYDNDDTLTGIEGVNGTNFDDVITGGSAPQEFFIGNGGNDLIDGAGGNDYLDGGAGDDTLIGGAGSDNFVGGQGDDILRGSTITDLINYADLNAVNYGSSGSGIVMNLDTGIVQDGMGGTDMLSDINWITGSGHADHITGSSGIYFEQFDGGAGDDHIDGGAINPLTFANGNRVTYVNSGTAVRVDLAAGTATGGLGNDTLANINHVFGSMHADTLLGSDSAIPESFNGRAGADFIDGAGGLDEVRYTNANRAVNVNLALGTATDGEGPGTGPGSTDTLRNIEGVRGSNFNDTLTGGNTASDALEFFMGMSGSDVIDGGSGYDRADYNSSSSAVQVTLGGSGDGFAFDGFVVNGQVGRDTLRNVEAVRGSSFNDTLTGSDTGAFESFEGREGNDSINGMGGIDRADYQSSAAGVNVNLALGTAADGWGGTDTLVGIENVRGSSFADILAGDGAANLLQGGAGNDTLQGGGGDDVLAGGAGNDALTGGEGADQFMFEATGNGVDAIADFTEADQVLVAGTVTGRSTAGNGSSLGAGAMQASTSNGQTTLYIGTDAVAGADVEIRFQGTFDVTAFLATGTADGYTAIELDTPQGGPSRVAELAVQIRAAEVAQADVASKVAGKSTTNEVAVARVLEALGRVHAGQDVAGEAAAMAGADAMDVAAAAPWGVAPLEMPLV